MAVSIKIEIEGFEGSEDVKVRMLKGEEKMSSCYSYDVTIEMSADSVGDFNPIGKTATLIFKNPGSDEHNVNAIVAEYEEITDPDLPADLARFRLRVTHAIWFTSLVKKTKIYVDQNLHDVLAEQLDTAGVTHKIDDFENIVCSERPLTTQYKESSFNFISRIMEDRGVYYYFNHKDGDTITISDSPSQYGDEIQINKGEIEPGSWSRKVVAGPTKVILKAYDYTQPSHEIIGEAELDDDSGMEYLINSNDELVLDEEHAQALAEIRLAQFRTESDYITFRSFNYLLSPGSTFTYKGGEYLVTSIHHTYIHEDAKKDGDPNHYRNSVIAIKADTLYRPKLSIRRPFAEGVEIGHIHSSTDSDKAMIDENGLYTVILNYVTESDNPPVSKLRMEQKAAGQDDGIYFPLKDQVEVIIAFTKGNPDLPYIHGAMSNGQFPSHVKGDQYPHQSIIKAKHTLLMQSLGGKHVKDVSNDFASTPGDYCTENSEDKKFVYLNADGTQNKSEMSDEEEHSGDHHISRRYGHKYSFINGNDYNWHCNPTYNFGSGYVENHIYSSDYAHKNFSMNPPNGISEDSSLVSKSWGDVCEYRNGRTVQWGENEGGSLEQYNFGSRFTSNQVSLTGQPVMCPWQNEEGFVDATEGNKFSYHEGDTESMTRGDVKSFLDGNSDQTINGDSETKQIGNVDQFTKGDVTSMHSGNTTSTTQGDTTSTTIGNITSTITGSVTSSHFGTISDTKYVGSTSMAFGATLDEFLGFKSANTQSGYITTNLGVGMNIDMSARTEVYTQALRDIKIDMDSTKQALRTGVMLSMLYKFILLG